MFLQLHCILSGGGRDRPEPFEPAGCRRSGLDAAGASQHHRRRLKKNFRAVAILLLVAATFAVDWPALQDGFVWDDTALVLRDPLIRSWRLVPEGFRHFLFTDATASNFYRPVQRLSYTLDYALYAFKPRGYHLTNILLHAAAAVALFFCAQQLIEKARPADAAKSPLPAWIAAFAWAIHPVHSAAVTYVSGRADVLAALFGFTGLFLAARAAVAKKPGAGEWGAALCFLAAMLSKESGAMALIIWIAALLFFRDFSRLRKWVVFAAAILAVYCGMRFSAEKSVPPPGEPVPPAVRPILIARAAAEYAGLLAAPVNLHMERDLIAHDRGDLQRTIREARAREYQTLLGLVLISGFVLWLRWTRWRQPAASFFLIAFFLAYLPTSNLFSLNATAAEHWLYFSSAFLFVAAALSLEAAPVPRRPMMVALAAWFGFLGARMFLRNFDWKDQRTFLESTAVCGGNSSRTMINRGLLESSEGNQKLAVAFFQCALQQSPGQSFALLGLGSAYFRSHDFEKARAQFEAAERIPFVKADALEKLAVLDWQERRENRVDLLREAARLAPKNWEIQKRYITDLDERGETAEAVRELRALLERQPFRADSWEMLGKLLVKIHRPDLAAAAHARAAELDVHLK